MCSCVFLITQAGPQRDRDAVSNSPNPKCRLIKPPAAVPEESDN